MHGLIAQENELIIVQHQLNMANCLIGCYMS